MGDTNYIVITGIVTAVTDKAVMLQMDDSPNADNDVWVPRSVINEGRDVEFEDTDLEVAEWFCDKEGLV